MKVYILTHTDLDGFFSGAIVKWHMKRIHSDEDIEITTKTWTYGHKLPSAKYLTKNFDRVFICDLAPDAEFVTELLRCDKPNFLSWIDHHSAPDRELMDICGDGIEGLRTTEKLSAAALCWQYFSDRELPEWLRLLSDFDSWNRADDTKYWSEKIMPYFHFLSITISGVESAYDFIVKNNLLDENSGYDVLCDLCTGLMYKQAMDAEYIREAKHGYPMELTAVIDGVEKCLKGYVLNTQLRGSSIFQDLPTKDEYDVFIVYNYNGKKYQYSMYTFKEDVQCNGCTLRFPDGFELTFRGHRDAAGSNSEIFPLIGNLSK